MWHKSRVLCSKKEEGNVFPENILPTASRLQHDSAAWRDSFVGGHFCGVKGAGNNTLR